jgi:hypothetical protein
MRKLLRWRPSAAMIVAVAALTMAMVGTGFAVTALSKKEKKQVKNIFGTQFSGRVMAATVPGGDSCAITNQTGGITAVLVGSGQTGVCDVTFPKSVANCSVGATPTHPVQDIAGQASTRPLGASVVRVTRRNGLDNFQAAGLFNIFAVCPA